MESIYHVARKGELSNGKFGTLFECATWVLQQEGISEEPDPIDPVESLNEQLGFDPDSKYDFEPAATAVPKMVSIDEAMRLKSLPRDIKISEIPDWLSGDHTNDTLKQMVDVLHGRTNPVRWRGSFHSVGASPFTTETYSALLTQLS